MFLAKPNPYGTMRVARHSSTPARLAIDPSVFQQPTQDPAQPSSEPASPSDPPAQLSLSSPIVPVNTAEPVFNSAGNQLFGMDAELELKRRDKLDPEHDKKALEWLSTVTGDPIDLENWQQSLKSGITLCKMANLVAPNAIKFDLRPIPLVERENIAKYLEFCARWGCESNQMFGISDLYERKSLESVITNIYSMARVVERANGFKGPTLAVKPVDRARSMIIRNSPSKGRTNVMDIWTNAINKAQDLKETAKQEPASAPVSKVSSPAISQTSSPASSAPSSPSLGRSTTTTAAAATSSLSTSTTATAAAAKEPEKEDDKEEVFQLPTTGGRFRGRMASKFFATPKEEDTAKSKLEKRREQLAAMVALEKEKKEVEERERSIKADKVKADLEALKEKERKAGDEKVKEKEKERLAAEEKEKQEKEAEKEKQRKNEREKEREKEKEKESELLAAEKENQRKAAEERERNEKEQAAEKEREARRREEEAKLKEKEKEKPEVEPIHEVAHVTQVVAPTPVVASNSLIANGFGFLVLYALINILVSPTSGLSSTLHAFQTDCVFNALLLLFLGHALIPQLSLSSGESRQLGRLAIGFSYASLLRTVVIPWLPVAAQTAWVGVFGVLAFVAATFAARIVWRHTATRVN